MAEFEHLPIGAAACSLTQGEITLSPLEIEEFDLHAFLGVDDDPTPYAKLTAGDELPLRLADRLYPVYGDDISVDEYEIPESAERFEVIHRNVYAKLWELADLGLLEEFGYDSEDYDPDERHQFPEGEAVPRAYAEAHDAMTWEKMAVYDENGTRIDPTVGALSRGLVMG